jgi:ferritin-like metal-binding protein YciE
MLNICDLKGLYKHGLRELYSGVVQAAVVLPTLATSIESVQLRGLVEQQAAQAAKHQLRLAAVLTVHGALDYSVADPAVAALLRSAESFTAQVGDADLRDAALLSVLRRVMHYEVVACAVIVGHAKALSLAIDRHTLIAMLGEARATERDLADLEGEESANLEIPGGA